MYAMNMTNISETLIEDGIDMSNSLVHQVSGLEVQTSVVVRNQFPFHKLNAQAVDGLKQKIDVRTNGPVLTSGEFEGATVLTSFISNETSRRLPAYGIILKSHQPHCIRIGILSGEYMLPQQISPPSSFERSLLEQLRSIDAASAPSHAHGAKAMAAELMHATTALVGVSNAKWGFDPHQQVHKLTTGARLLASAPTADYMRFNQNGKNVDVDFKILEVSEGMLVLFTDGAETYKAPPEQLALGLGTAALLSRMSKTAVKAGLTRNLERMQQ